MWENDAEKLAAIAKVLPHYTADRRLYLRPDGSMSETPQTGGSLLVGEGGSIMLELAEQHGLVPPGTAEGVTVEAVRSLYAPTPNP